ncbi:MAG: hypothetical protein ABIN01_21485 [Ferruginibacter sp.]
MEIKNSADLKDAITRLEVKKLREKEQLSENFHVFTESLKPINLIKSTFARVKETPGITGSVLKAGVGLGIGILSKKFLIGKTTGIFKSVLGSAIEMGIAGLVAKKSGTIKASGSRLLSKLFGSKSNNGTL